MRNSCFVKRFLVFAIVFIMIIGLLPVDNGFVVTAKAKETEETEVTERVTIEKKYEVDGQDSKVPDLRVDEPDDSFPAESADRILPGLNSNEQAETSKAVEKEKILVLRDDDNLTEPSDEINSLRVDYFNSTASKSLIKNSSKKSIGKMRGTAPNYQGNGTNEDPWLIETAEDLLEFAESVNKGNTYSGCTVEMANDIDLSSICGSSINGCDASFPKISSFNGVAFEGTFDGMIMQSKVSI